jgi:hypothetical protein
MATDDTTSFCAYNVAYPTRIRSSMFVERCLWVTDAPGGPAL